MFGICAHSSLCCGRSRLVRPKTTCDDVLPFCLVDAPVHLLVVDIVSQYPRSSVCPDPVPRQHYYSLLAKVVDKRRHLPRALKLVVVLCRELAPCKPCLDYL